MTCISCVHASLRICLVGIILGGGEIGEKMTKFSYKISCSLKLTLLNIFLLKINFENSTIGLHLLDSKDVGFMYLES